MIAAAELELRLRPSGADGAYVAAVDYTNAGGATVALLDREAAVRLDGAARQELLALTLDPAAYGARLSELLFADTALREGLVRARTGASSARVPLRIRLRLDSADPGLHGLVWETLQDPERSLGGRFLFADERVLLSRYLESPDLTPVVRPPRAGLSALVAVADPSDGVDRGLAPVEAAEEIGRARAALGDIPVTELARAADDAAVTLARLVAALRGTPGEPGPDVLYLVCHGGRERALGGAGSSGPSFLCLEREDGRLHRVPAAALVDALAGLSRRPVLVVLAACQSAGRTHDAGALAAAGPGLARAGVGAVVAMQTDVAMATVEQLMPEFFRELLRDGQIDRALAAARAAVVRDRPDWWAPVLYLRLRDGRLWTTAEATDDPHDVAGLDNPYLGLEPYTYERRGRFAGREEAVVEAVRRLTAPGEAQTLLFVTGTSGCGEVVLRPGRPAPGPGAPPPGAPDHPPAGRLPARKAPAGGAGRRPGAPGPAPRRPGGPVRGHRHARGVRHLRRAGHGSGTGQPGADRPTGGAVHPV